MTDTVMQIGSLSNDLFRVASLYQRGSHIAAQRFLLEAKRWAMPLKMAHLSPYIIKIAQDVAAKDPNDFSIADAEKYLMYGILLQNYALHNR